MLQRCYKAKFTVDICKIEMGDLSTPFKSASALERRVKNHCYIKPELSKTADVSQGSKFPSFYSLIKFLVSE